MCRASIANCHTSTIGIWSIDIEPWRISSDVSGINREPPHINVGTWSIDIEPWRISSDVSGINREPVHTNIGNIGGFGSKIVNSC